MLQLRQRSTLSGADHGWLNAKHHFAFGADSNPAHQPLGCLVVWNDDEIAPHTGFPMHGHKDMEIVTYVREGAVEHTDSEGNRGYVKAGDVQAFTAGTGIRHAEANGGDDILKIFQIWLLPRRRAMTPTWASLAFPKADRSGRLVALASGMNGDEDAVPIGADARVMGATLKPGDRIDYPIGVSRFGYLVPALGVVHVNGIRVGTGDGIAISNEATVEIVAEVGAEIVFVDAG